jgi:hypothetical protein
VVIEAPTEGLSSAVANQLDCEFRHKSTCSNHWCEVS